jgi:glycosyl transferase family 25
MPIPSFLINLDRCSDRLGMMNDRFSQLGLGCERVQAVDGKTLDDADIAAVRVTVPGWIPLSAAEVACFLSHRKCWELIVARQDAYGCIFEDDVLLSPRLSVFLSDARWIPDDADIVKIETLEERVWIDAAAAAYPVAGFELHRLRSMHSGAAGYILSRDVAARLLALTRRFSVAADFAIFHPAYGIANRMTIYQLRPALCIQAKQHFPQDAPDQMGTTIQERGHFQREGWLARRAHWAEREGRKLWHRLNRRERTVVEFDGCE